MTLEDLYIQICEKDNCRIFDFGPFVIEFVDGSLTTKVYNKPSLIKIVSTINQNIEEEKMYENKN